jgi:hypothetical protein
MKVRIVPSNKVVLWKSNANVFCYAVSYAIVTIVVVVIVFTPTTVYEKFNTLFSCRKLQVPSCQSSHVSFMESWVLLNGKDVTNDGNVATDWAGYVVLVFGCRPAVTSYIQGRTRSDLSCKSPNQDAGNQHNESTLGTQTVPRPLPWTRAGRSH